MEYREREHTLHRQSATERHTHPAPRPRRGGAGRGPRNTQHVSVCRVRVHQTRSSPDTPRQREQGARPSSPCALPLLFILLPYALLLVCVLLEEYTLDLSLGTLDRRAYAPGCQHSIKLATTPLGTAGLFGVAETARGRRAGE